jgi:carotenoid cleavage dioxygenase-like enzyme
VDEDGSTYTIGLSFLTGVKYNIIRIPPTTGDQKMKDVIKKHKVIATIPSSHATLLSYVHSFGITKNYIVFIEQPFLISVPKVLSAAVRKSDCLQDWVEWRPEMKNKFILVNKATGKVFKTDVFSHEAFFFLHAINCFEEDGQIIFDVSAFKNTDFLNSLVLDRLRLGDNNIPHESLPVGTRYVIPLVDLKNVQENVNLVTFKTTATAIRKGGHIILTPEINTKPGLEFPTINRNFLGKKTNYYYATGTATKSYFENAISKVDVAKKETVLWKEDYCFFGEPLFVPRPNGSSEDDGIVLVAASNTQSKGKDFLLCLDAKSMKELGRAQFSSRIPQALHGVFAFSSN